MLPRADLAGTRPTAAIERTAPTVDSVDARIDTGNRLTQIALGRQLQASVLSRFDDGSFLVRLADDGARLHSARMQLPTGSRVGDTLSMTMLAHAPRPTLLLNTASGGAPATLSSAGRLIDALLHMAPEGKVPPLAGKAPLLPAAALQPGSAASALLAGSLQSAVDASGLFYESHLQEWLTGARSTAELAREPQAALAHGTGPAMQPQAALLPMLQRAQSHLEQEDERPAVAGTPPDGANALTDADLVTTPLQAESLGRESLELLRQQLHTLEQRQFAWQGELFPGTPLRWEVGEDAPSAAPGAERSWHSTVRFELPHLGTVAATLVLSGDQLRIRVATASEQATDVLRASGGQLADALQAAGTRLDALLVSRDDQA